MEPVIFNKKNKIGEVQEDSMQKHIKKNTEEDHGTNLKENETNSLDLNKIEVSEEEIIKKKQKCRIIIIIISIIIVVAIILIISLILTKKSDEDIINDEYFEGGTSENLQFLTWEEAKEKAKKKLNRLSTDEKLSLLFGTHNMEKDAENGACVGNIDPIKGKFKGICLQDGPTGVRYSKNTQSWQAPINTASTFNKTLMYEVGKAQGKEFRDKGINIALLPSMNILRSPQGGRIWENFGEDPFLSGIVATQIIKGVQSNGVICTAKHFIGNDQETEREYTSSNIKEQAFYEIYFEPFFRSIKDAEVGAIMAAYNKFNGTFCVKNKKLLQDILKDKIGFKGFIMSDWWAIKDNDLMNFNSGLDMNMPGGYGWKTGIGREKSYWSNFKKYLGKEITYDRLNDAVERILASMYKLDQFNSNNIFPKIDLMKNTITDETKKLNREAATQSIVLLKNENNILPIKSMSGKKIAIIGNNAFESPCIREYDCSCKTETNNIYRGHLSSGYGSGTTYYNYNTYPLSSITSRAIKEGIEIISSDDIIQDHISFADRDNFAIGKENIEKAKEVAEEADLCIVFIMADSGERYIELEKSKGDRYDLNAWHGGNELIEAVLEKNSNVIVVINSPGPINLPWLNNIKGLIFCGLGGAESGNAITHILFGDYNPSGHLPYVWADKDNYPVSIDIYSRPINLEYTEGVFIGQRYFDKYNKEYIFPFGYGLSYTTFEFITNSLSVNMSYEGLKINFSVKNSGNLEGEVVPMIFLKFPESIKAENGYPEKVFKGFDKKWITPNEIANFEILVDEHALSYYDVYEKNYIRPSVGMYIVYVGFNAKDYNLLQTEIDANY